MQGETRTNPRPRWATWILVAFLVSVFGIVAGCGGDGGNKSKNPLPALTSVSPATAVAGDAAFTLTANGTGFVSGSTVQWNGASRSTTFVSSTQLTAAIEAQPAPSYGRYRPLSKVPRASST